MDTGMGTHVCPNKPCSWLPGTVLYNENGIWEDFLLSLTHSVNLNWASALLLTDFFIYFLKRELPAFSLGCPLFIQGSMNTLITENPNSMEGNKRAMLKIHYIKDGM